MDSEAKNVIDLAKERRRRGPRFTGGLMDILEVSRDLVCLCRQGAITAINGAGVRLLGATSTEQLLGRDLTDFLIPEYGSVMALFLAGKASEDKAVPTRLVGLDQKVREVELQVYRAREIAADATVVMCRDVSPAGQAAGYIHPADGRFSRLVDNAMNLVCHVRDGVVVYVNRAGLRLLGAASAAEVVGRPVAEFFHADYAQILRSDLLDSVVAEPDGVPMRLLRLDGRPVDALVVLSRLPADGGTELMVEARDITAHNQAVTALRHANETLEMRVAQRTRELAGQRALADEHRRVADAARRFSESLLDMVPNPVWYKDARGRFETCNGAFRHLFGCDPARVLGGAAIVAAAMPEEDAVTDRQILAGATERAVFDAAILAPGGSRHHAVVSKCAYLDEEGRPVGVLGVITDITERKAMERELRRLATTDPLTGAANRRQFLHAAAHEMDRATRYDSALSVVILDVDHFKRVNDTHGHAIGDEALKAVAATIQAQLREVDLLGRLGGEEFAVLLPETSAGAAGEVAERLRRAVAALRLPVAADAPLAITASLGVAARLAADPDFDTLLARADRALYAAKDQGRDRVVTAL